MDRSEHSANRDLHARATLPRPGRIGPESDSVGAHWAWQTLFAFFCGISGAAFLIWGWSA